jgi:hypothetical protein
MAALEEGGLMTSVLKSKDSGAQRIGFRAEPAYGEYQPHGYLIGSQQCPTQICIYGVTGGRDRWLSDKLLACSPVAGRAKIKTFEKFR